MKQTETKFNLITVKHLNSNSNDYYAQKICYSEKFGHNFK